MSKWDGSHSDSFVMAGRLLNVQSFSGTIEVDLLSEAFLKQNSATFSSTWAHATNDVTLKHENFQPIRAKYGSFCILSEMAFFLVWYPSLISTITGVAVLHFRRQFSIRSALVTTAIVAALIGVAVVL